MESAATRRGWVTAMRPASPRPASRQIFGQLSALARAGLAGDDDDGVRLQCREDFVPAVADGQGGWVSGDWAIFASLFAQASRVASLA